MRDWLKALRNKNSMSQDDIAKELKISQKYYSFIERGEKQKDMSLSLALKLSRIFHISITDIIELEKLK